MNPNQSCAGISFANKSHNANLLQSEGESIVSVSPGKKSQQMSLPERYAGISLEEKTPVKLVLEWYLSVNVTFKTLFRKEYWNL